MNSKVIKSMFMLMISFIFASLCITFAWFTGIRIQNVGGSGIKLGNVTGELYVYNGNKVVLNDPQAPIAGSSSEDKTEWPGFPANEKQSGKFNFANDAFTKFELSGSNMRGAKPSSRYLFVLKAKSNHADPVDIKLTIDDWLSTGNISNISDQASTKIYLTEAIYMYTNASADHMEKPLASDTNPALNDQDLTSIMSWVDSLVIDNSLNHTPNDIYALNKFQQTTSSNQSNGALNKTVPIGQWNGIDSNKYYLYPFIVEFTNDVNTYYKLGSNGVYTKYNGGDTYGYNSNIYAGLTFDIKQLSLTQMDIENGNPHP